MKTEVTRDEVAELRRHVEKLQEENNSLALQLGHAFEELTLIQELAAHLAISESDSEAPACSRLVGSRFAELLTQTLDTLEGESLCLLTAAHEVIWTVGTQRPDAIWRQLSMSLAEKRSGGPVVWNQPWNDQIHHAVLAQLSNGGTCYGWLVASNRIGMLSQDGFTSFEASFLTKVASMLAVHLHNTKLLHDSQALFADMVRALVSAVDARDPYTCGHSERVALFARQLAKAAGLPPAECRRIYFCGLLHDIGKLAVPDAILRKEERLSDEERSIMADHPENGRKILSNVDALSSMLDGVLHHHECIDGSGYPMQLSGELIPPDARLLAICDAYDAMTSDRPYRDGMPPAKAAEILREGAGTQWDAGLVELFLANLDAMIDIAAQHASMHRPNGCHEPDLAEPSEAKTTRGRMR